MCGVCHWLRSADRHIKHHDTSLIHAILYTNYAPAAPYLNEKPPTENYSSNSWGLNFQAHSSFDKTKINLIGPHGTP